MSFGRSSEHLPDRLVGPLGMAVRLGPGDAFVHEPGIQFVMVLDPQARCEEAFAHQADLVLDLTLLPTRRRRAGDGLDEMVRAHLEEAAIVLAILADEDRLHRSLRVMGWTSPAILPALPGTKEGNMSLKLLAIDLGKRSFHCHGIDSDGVIF